ncbi:carbamoyltransferase HypF [candidate division WOR-3 bacterium]|nr:carbamoyltransferase HypF [candidate division WOR-3 bacterium]
MRQRKRINVRGIVQGVGFRPFVYRAAHDLDLAGFVRNTTEGVDIEVEGDKKRIEQFLSMLQGKKPPAAVIDTLDIHTVKPRNTRRFVIRKSTRRDGFTHIAPDIATCEDCRRELCDPEDRRYRYPFINCTNCGPRYSIIRETPYDRAQTSMASFMMCEKCTNEFKDVFDRRFHAQPDCCAQCGPAFVLYALKHMTFAPVDPVIAAGRLLRRGSIIAIKGTGGFHIACDATNTQAVRRLRQTKKRPAKPFAIMCTLPHARTVAYISDSEEECLCSPIAPIVVLRKQGSRISDAVAPHNPYIGIMLPYLPIHYLLLEIVPFLIMTSGNIQDEPIARDVVEVKGKLGSIVTHVLTHERAIENRCDDSVGFVFPNRGFSIIRRSRGYVPSPLELPDVVMPVLALGPELKSTFVLASNREAYMSPHIGDLDNLETLEFFKEMITKYQRWFRIDPVCIAHDLHPDYLSTRIAADYALPQIAVQHHVAHIMSCLGECGIHDRAIGIAFDGTGYGLDGRIWGGEFFVGDLIQQERVAHLEYLPLPGGDSSIRRPYRIAIAYAAVLCDRIFKPGGVSRKEVCSVLTMLKDHRSTIETSSMGRLFDCVAGMIGLVREITYEAEGAINLEYCAVPRISGRYRYSLIEDEPLRISVAPIIEGVLADLEKGVARSTIAAKFHNTIVQFSLEVVQRLSTLYKTRLVCLSGGVFQNRRLLVHLVQELEKAGFTVYTHRRLPTNDGCISYGQVIYAHACRLKDKQG